MRITLGLSLLLFACGPTGRVNMGGGNNDMSVYTPPDFFGYQPPEAGSQNCGEAQGCYTVYAHSDHVLYRIDLTNKLLITIGNFNAPKISGAEDSITDLAVAPDDTIYVISKTNLYTASPTNAQVTLVSPVAACGGYAVALTFTPDGSLYAGDHKGAFCSIDISSKPPRLNPLGNVGSGFGLAGDLVAVADGTMYGTVYTITDATSENNNTLVTIDPKSGAVIKTIGKTGFPRLFGVAYENGQVFGFTGDGSGNVVTIDPKTGTGTLYNSFMDPATGKGITFGGAGVNAKVPPMIM